MYVKKIKDTTSYEAPNHQKCHSLRLSGFEEYGPENFWVGHSQFLPGGGAGPDASPLEKVYIISEGQLNIKANGETKTKNNPNDNSQGDKADIQNQNNISSLKENN